MFDGACEVGVDFEAVEVADDQEGRILEVFAVLEELFVGGSEIFVFAFVFPAEVASEPDVGPAVASGCWRFWLGGSLALPSGVCFSIVVVNCGFADTAFEGVPSAFGIGGGRFGLAEEVAEVEEVLLACAALGELSGLPLLNEFVRSQGEI